jgi:hypothetical protein
MRASILRVFCAGLAIWTAACSPGQPLRVSTIQVGKSLNSDDSIGTLSTSFRPDDTIYVSVLTTGHGSATIVARWMYNGRVVSEPAREVSYTSDAATEFHIQNSGGFPPGDYKVEILVDGEKAGEREFRVQ